ncbi:MAG: vitamin K epoxide reductase family protein [Patescibacteria group bacterium]|jgi:uncharacterized membrane protein
MISLTRKTSILSYVVAVAALLGFFDASYLALKHFQGIAPTCTLLEGCEVVTTSSYAVVFGIPVALAGGFYYLAVLLLAVAFIDLPQRWKIDAAALMVSVGMLATVWFVYLQIFVIHAFCLYCLFSALTTTVLFALVVSIRRIVR